MSFLFNNNKNQHCKNANNVKSFTDIKQVIQQFSTLTSDELKHAIRKLPITDPNDRIALWKCFLLNNTNNNNKSDNSKNSNSNNRNHASGDTQTALPTTTTTTMIDQQQQILYHKLLINGQLSSFHQHNLDRIRKDIHRTFPHLDYFNPTITTTTPTPTTTTTTPTPTTTTTTTTTTDANTTNDSTNNTNNTNNNNNNNTNNHHNHHTNNTNNGQHLLKNILYAYSVFDGQVGYVQGMAFIAGYLLYHTRNEIDSFYMFIQLMNHKHYNTKDLFIHGLPLLKWLLSETNRVTLDLLPQSLSQMMDQECISAEMYASHFFLTLCTTRFPFDTVNRIWDLFLSESWPIIIRLIMGLFLYYEQELMDKIVNATSAEMITHLYHLCSTMDVYTLDHHVLQLFESDDNNENENESRDRHHHHHAQVLDQIDDECMWLHYHQNQNSSSSSTSGGSSTSSHHHHHHHHQNRSHRSNSNSSSSSSHSHSHNTNSSGGGGRNVQLALDSYQPFQLLSSSPSSNTSNKLVAHFKRRFSLFFSSSSNNNTSEEENNHTTSSTTTTTTIAHTATTATTTTTAPIPINSHSAHTTTTVQQQQSSSSSSLNKKQQSHASYIVSPPSTSSSYTDHVIENYLDNPSVATSSSYNLGAKHHSMHNHDPQQEQQEQMIETAHNTNNDIQEEEEEEVDDDDKHEEIEEEDVNMNALLENDDHAREQCTKDESAKSIHDSIVANDVDSTDAVVTPAANNDHDHHHTFSILVNGDSTVVFTLKNHNQHVQYKHKS